MRSLPNLSVEREFMKESTSKDSSVTVLSNSGCKTRENSPLSWSLRVLLVLIALAVSFSASDFPHKTSVQGELQSIADKNKGTAISRFKLFSNCSITMDLILSSNQIN